jgi:hypothetical protein
MQSTSNPRQEFDTKKTRILVETGAHNNPDKKIVLAHWPAISLMDPCNDRPQS